MAGSKEFKCPWVNPVTGRPCANPTIYTRRYNLNRHIEQRHKGLDAASIVLEQPRTFINWKPRESLNHPRPHQSHTPHAWNATPLPRNPYFINVIAEPSSCGLADGNPQTPVFPTNRSQQLLLPPPPSQHPSLDTQLRLEFLLEDPLDPAQFPPVSREYAVDRQTAAADEVNIQDASTANEDESRQQILSPQTGNSSNEQGPSVRGLPIKHNGSGFGEANEDQSQQQVSSPQTDNGHHEQDPPERGLTITHNGLAFVRDKDGSQKVMPSLEEGSDEQIAPYGESLVWLNDSRAGEEDDEDWRVEGSTSSSLGEDSLDINSNVVDHDNGSIHLGPLSTRKRKSPSRESVPEYDTKQSKKNPSQQRAILWMTAAGKAHFDEYLKPILYGWGVGPAHEATCVSLPAAWSALSPMTLMEIFEYPKCPLKNTDNSVSYKFDDHRTSLTRAAAWFNNTRWDERPPRGVDLDNFLGSRPWQKIHGSHLCHHEYCLLHLVLESDELNEDRKKCHERAQFLRGEEKAVLERCDCAHHVPRCFLRLAALTEYESYLVQFSKLRQARGLSSISQPQRPRRHQYRTFEYQLPFKFCEGSTPSVALNDIITAPQTPKDKPDLICPFCDRIVAFAGVIGIWSHIFHQHKKEPNECRLHAIREKGDLWREYYSKRTHMGRNDPTSVKLEQIAREDFDWQVVVSWRLR